MTRMESKRGRLSGGEFGKAIRRQKKESVGYGKECTFYLGSVRNQCMVSRENGTLILCDPLNIAIG